MKHSLIMLSTVCLALAATASGAVEKGDVAIEIMGGWAIEKTEAADVSAFGADIFDEFLSGGTGTDLTSWFVMGGLGRFVSDNLMIGVAGFYTQMEGDTETFPVAAIPGATIEADLDMTAFGIGARGRYHFNPTGDWVPYFGAQVLWVSADVDVEVSVPGFEEIAPPDKDSDSANGILWGPILGLRAELSKRNELLFEYQFHLWAGGISDILKDGHAFFVGLSHRFE